MGDDVNFILLHRGMNHLPDVRIFHREETQTHNPNLSTIMNRRSLILGLVAVWTVAALGFVSYMEYVKVH